MKLIFICGSLEPGRDGVGDYTRRLSCELIRQGHFVGIVALNDSNVFKTIEEIQQNEGTNVSVLRIPNALNNTTRYAELGSYIARFDPEWLSLQFVPFSFNRKGIPLGMARWLRSLRNEVRWHIMFHELWVNGDDLKSKAIALLQKLSIRRLISTLSPALITTTIPLYKRNLVDKNVVMLPIFSNISIADAELNRDLNTSKFFAVHFGNFSSALSEFREQISWVQGLAKCQNKDCYLIIVGNGGRFERDALAIANEILGDKKVIKKGMLPESEISKLLSASDVGISRADKVFWGKSGTSMAMLEHGLPVLLRGEGSQSDLSFAEFRDNYKKLLFFTNFKYSEFPGKISHRSMLCLIASDFVTLLSKTPEN